MKITCVFFFNVLIVLPFFQGSSAAKECLQKKYTPNDNPNDDQHIVCVCNEEHCDTVDPVEKVEPPAYLKYTSNKAGLRFEKIQDTFINNHQQNYSYSNDDGAIIITINRNETFQSIIGWGGAFTDATGINIKALGPKAQEHLLRSYFSDEGIEYTLGRVPIGGTDFSYRSYSYDDTEEADPDLEHFDLVQEDFDYKIPYILRSKELSNDKIKLFASAWTAPIWAKTNNATHGYGFLKEEYYRTWANYFLRFLEEYEKNNISFWGITTGNEPSLAMVPLKPVNSIGWNPEMLGKWVAEDLGPVLRNSKYADITLMTIDDQRFYLPWFVESIFQNETAMNYIDGIAVHWYEDLFVDAAVLSTTHEKFPNKFILGTEACEGYMPFGKGVKLGEWERAESYIKDIIQDLQNWVTGWTDWCMALDLTGGPTYIDNFVDSPIIVNASAGEFYKQPMYYGFGHFTKFLPPNSLRIGTTTSTTNELQQLSIVAFVTQNNSTVLEIFNKNEENLEVLIRDDIRGTISLNLTAHSMTTVIYW